MHTELYLKQQKRWPGSGRHIMARFDDETIIVYQAFQPSIGFICREASVFWWRF